MARTPMPVLAVKSRFTAVVARWVGVPEMTRKYLEAIVGAAFFIAFVVAHLAFSASTAVKVMGVAGVVTGVVWCFGKSIPVGIESRPPSFLLRGVPAILLGIAMVGFGIILLRYSVPAACLLGWAKGVDCG